MNRLSQIYSHLHGKQSDLTSIKSKHPDDVVIVSALRTPIARGRKGGFKDLKTEDILYLLLSEFKKQNIIEFEKIEDVACGNVLNPGAGANELRAAALAAGIPYQTPFVSINRQCSSGLMSVNYIANQIATGQINIGLACGAESMTTFFGPKAAPAISDLLLDESDEAAKCLIPMGITNENIAEKFGIDRPTQDRFAANSYAKAEKALASNAFAQEILPIPVGDKVISKDEGVRPGTTFETLSKLRASFKQDGTTHAGNSSQVSDGAALVLLARRSVAETLSLPIVGKYVSTQVVGVPPEIMGVGPAYAIPKLLSSVNVGVSDIDIFEINEAFAAQCLYSVESCGIPYEKVNPRGGAIALGHPLGCTGARLVATLLSELIAGQLGVVSMCIGSGMGAAALFVKE
ncbi:acetyl-CoA C-acyltransferase [Saccharomycopsis crataegensis]|uniref:acetyl-CoA C-acyltransferase n=1 Tax=Saccharomycopsis crataegensis TaxID=43959 RepID=A0AAV5QKT3_9ASCO|nr:acetyl-CoA C-acyltransferase [Saccharomycopsis crataegensis]